MVDKDSDLKVRVVKMMRNMDSVRCRGSHIFFTKEDEAEINETDPQWYGDFLAEKIKKEGARAAFPVYMGFRTVWDAEETKLVDSLCGAVAGVDWVRSRESEDDPMPVEIDEIKDMNTETKEL